MLSQGRRTGVFHLLMYYLPFHAGGFDEFQGPKTMEDIQKCRRDLWREVCSSAVLVQCDHLCRLFGTHSMPSGTI